jgi:hypothetical protein
MDNAFLVGVFQRFDQLANQGQRLVDRYRSLLDATGKGCPFHEFENQSTVLDAMNCRDVGMIQ